MNVAGSGFSISGENTFQTDAKSVAAAWLRKCGISSDKYNWNHKHVRSLKTAGAFCGFGVSVLVPVQIAILVSSFPFAAFTSLCLTAYCWYAPAEYCRGRELHLL